jgi:hypothetical protein
MKKELREFHVNALRAAGLALKSWGPESDDGYVEKEVVAEHVKYFKELIKFHQRVLEYLK